MCYVIIGSWDKLVIMLIEKCVFKSVLVELVLVVLSVVLVVLSLVLVSFIVLKC